MITVGITAHLKKKKESLEHFTPIFTHNAHIEPLGGPVLTLELYEPRATYTRSLHESGNVL